MYNIKCPGGGVRVDRDSRQVYPMTDELETALQEAGIERVVNIREGRLP
jgi:hypothetical protein